MGAGAAAGDLDAVGEVADQRQAEPDPGAVHPWAHSQPVVVDRYFDPVIVKARGHVDSPCVHPVAVRVHDRVRDRLCDNHPDCVPVDGDPFQRIQHRSARS